MTSATFIAIILIPSILFAAGLYLFLAFGLFNLAKRQNIQYAWLAWIPLANFALMGKLSDTQNSRTNFIIGIVLASVEFLIIIFGIVLLSAVADFVNNIWIYEYEKELPIEVVEDFYAAALLPVIFMSILSVAYYVLRIMLYFQFFKRYKPENASMYTVLTALFSVGEILVFTCRNYGLLPPGYATPQMNPYQGGQPNMNGNWQQPNPYIQNQRGWQGNPYTQNPQGGWGNNPQSNANQNPQFNPYAQNPQGGWSNNPQSNANQNPQFNPYAQNPQGGWGNNPQSNANQNPQFNPYSQNQPGWQNPNNQNGGYNPYQGGRNQGYPQNYGNGQWSNAPNNPSGYPGSFAPPAPPAWNAPNSAGARPMGNGGFAPTAPSVENAPDNAASAAESEKPGGDSQSTDQKDE